jgi:hypothetical protein
VHVADIAADPDYADSKNVASRRRTMLGVPLLREGAVVGSIQHLAIVACRVTIASLALAIKYWIPVKGV